MEEVLVTDEALSTLWRAEQTAVPFGETHLNMLVKSVYERPDSGLCVKLRSMAGPHRGTRHAAHIATFTAPIAQHMRLPSVALSIGWKTCT